MQDLLLIGIVIPGCVIALKLPWIGVMLWTWLSIMNPHRYTYGCAYSAPMAAMVVGFTLLGLLFSKEKESPFKGVPVTVPILFLVRIPGIIGSLAVDRVHGVQNCRHLCKGLL